MKIYRNLDKEYGSFDLIITQDVFEHIRSPELAWKEIYRVLKPGGYHLFTIPWSKDRKTTQRIKLEGDSEIEVLPKVFHGDNIRDGLVYTDYGYDLVDYLNSLEFYTRMFASNEMDSKLFRIYWNNVFLSQKQV